MISNKVVILIGVIGFEPTASWSQTRRSSQAELHPGNHGTWRLALYRHRLALCNSLYGLDARIVPMAA